MDFAEIINQLKQPFPAEDHEIRDLPGGKQWVYVKWQKIRARLNVVYPEWQISYSEPEYLGDYCHIRCSITIAGITRQSLGNAKIAELSNSGKEMGRGTPIERAIADAFKNAAESFGVGAYLDDQEYVIRYLKSQGDNRGIKLKQINEGKAQARYAT
jgi:hypothetical protein